ncbi:unnamed protein product [Ceratitis capitata]|uniref:(Mediterranean fruit fly) hypothetical protein n=1 Tax=Ceratitis capitata TaxID=7213 RepID=A0A811UW51_CERCA|nr:unnamed protein product [Ceratitis capitata]
MSLILLGTGSSQPKLQISRKINLPVMGQGTHTDRLHCEVVHLSDYAYGKRLDDPNTQTPNSVIVANSSSRLASIGLVGNPRWQCSKPIKALDITFSYGCTDDDNTFGGKVLDNGALIFDALTGAAIVAGTIGVKLVDDWLAGSVVGIGALNDVATGGGVVECDMLNSGILTGVLDGETLGCSPALADVAVIFAILDDDWLEGSEHSD